MYITCTTACKVVKVALHWQLHQWTAANEIPVLEFRPSQNCNTRCHATADEIAVAINNAPIFLYSLHKEPLKPAAEQRAPLFPLPPFISLCFDFCLLLTYENNRSCLTANTRRGTFFALNSAPGAARCLRKPTLCGINHSIYKSFYVSFAYELTDFVSKSYK